MVAPNQSQDAPWVHRARYELRRDGVHAFDGLNHLVGIFSSPGVFEVKRGRCVTILEVQEAQNAFARHDAE